MSTPHARALLLRELLLTWHEHPSERLGQLLTNIARDARQEIQDTWNWEEEKWLDAILRYRSG